MGEANVWVNPTKYVFVIPTSWYIYPGKRIKLDYFELKFLFLAVIRLRLYANLLMDY